MRHTDRRRGPYLTIVHSLTTLSLITHTKVAEIRKDRELTEDYAKYLLRSPTWTQQFKWGKIDHFNIQYSCYLCLGLFWWAIVCVGVDGRDLCSVKAGGKSCIIPSSVQWNGTKLRRGIMATGASVVGLLYQVRCCCHHRCQCCLSH